jgi:translation initiation factor 5A
MEDISPSTHNMDVPNVIRTEYQLVNIEDGFLVLMTGDGNTKSDVKNPETPMGEQIKTAFNDGKELMITVVAAMNEEHALSFKEAPN